ncbi:MAG TPA: DUF996 domain-containing protein [Nitrososphaerales archaeon]|nr:DUF996 domain-containing protein [Nitrososphaerales archaeon]
MGKLSDGKTLGGIGSILQIIPGVSIIGYILTLIGVKYISDELQDGSIFSDMLYAVITGIIGVAVGVFFILFGVVASRVTLGVSEFSGIAGFLAVAWVALIISAVFVRRAFEKMANRLNAPTFRTAGTLYLVGAVLVIVLVGFLILFIAYILQVIAFFSIQEPPVQSQQPQAAAMAAPTASAAPMKYCASCGTQMPSTATFCPKCGARQ